MSALNVDHSDWGKLVVSGDDRIRFVNGMCTSDIAKLPRGGWTRACVLSAKGRVLSIIEVMNRGDDLLILCEPQLADATLEVLDRHAIADDVAFERIGGPVHRAWTDPASVWDAPPVFAPPPQPVAAADAVEVRRVEAGFPRYGVDVTDANFPFETPLSRYIDYAKGCYVGQEPVARVHARGSAQKTLRGLRVAGEGPIAPGAEVSHPDRERAGRVTSSAVSPEFGTIALAYVHRGLWEPGTEVTVAGRRAEVVALPFGGC